MSRGSGSPCRGSSEARSTATASSGGCARPARRSPSRCPPATTTCSIARPGPRRGGRDAAASPWLDRARGRGASARRRHEVIGSRSRCTPGARRSAPADARPARASTTRRCSRYALDALHEVGAPARGVLAAWRLLRCNPWSHGGVDHAVTGGSSRRQPAPADRGPPDLGRSTGLHSTVGLPWAWAIVVLDLIVRMLLVPLTVKQIQSMQRLQAHAPEMKAIQQKYKRRPGRSMNEEMMKFYRENKINPAASCLPILLQIPIFISLFFVLRDFEDEVLPKYPDADLGWLDSSRASPSRSTRTGRAALLLVIYVVSQLASAYFMSTTMPSAALHLLVLPFVFIPFIINFPMGLMLYWLTTNLWTVGQGLVTRRLTPKRLRRRRSARRAPPRRRSRRRRAEKADAGRRRSRKPASPASSARARRKKKARGPPVTEVETSAAASSRPTGETVGEAKWAALRELERRFPVSTRRRCASRSSRGRARAPRRRLRAGEGDREAPSRAAGACARPRARAGHAAASCASCVEQVCSALGVRAGSRSPRTRRRSRDPRGRELGHADRQARPDDRRDPVPRERDRCGAAATRTARRSSSTPPAIATAAARRSRR